MPIRIPGRRMGRPDYSRIVQRVSLSAPTAEQGPYWAVVGPFTIGSGESIAILIERGFSRNYEYVPQGKRFLIDHLEVTADANVLLRVDLQHEDMEGELTTLGIAYGYQRVILEPRRAFYFRENTRPVYVIYNYGDVSIKVFMNIYGTVENVPG